MRLSISPKAWVAVGIIGVVFGFQNCAKPPQNVGQETSEDQTQTQFKTSEAKEYSVLSVSDSANGRVIDIDLNTGHSKIISMHGIDSGQRRCLDSELKSELDNLISQAQVCEPVTQIQDGTACTMIYEEAYASLKESSTIVSLGERFNGCMKAADLCGESSAQLRSTVAKIKAKIDSLNCQ